MGKGVLAADESLPTIGKRFKALEIQSTEESRRNYREILFTTPGLNEFISGVILFEETLRQHTKDGVQFTKLLADQGIVVGIKVDAGAVALANFAKEKITRGFDGLRERLAQYRELGARFTKWRAVIAIANGIPTKTCIEANTAALAEFAALSQEAGLVPIVEPEVLMDGDHSIERCEEVTTTTLRSLFASLSEHRVGIEQILLKSGMVLSGKDCPVQADVPEVAEATLRCFRRSVPVAVPGVLFLSGGQSDVAATERLNAICRVTDIPWTLTFSYGRALQDRALDIWHGSSKNVAAAQEALRHRAECNSLALRGEYSGQVERKRAAH